jgi:hypothetical protein
MSDQKLKLAVIIGSVRSGRFGPVVTQWFAEQAVQHGQFSVDVIDLAETPLPLPLPLPLPPEPPAFAPADSWPAEMAGLTAKLSTAGRGRCGDTGVQPQLPRRVQERHRLALLRVAGQADRLRLLRRSRRRRPGGRAAAADLRRTTRRHGA